MAEVAPPRIKVQTPGSGWKSPEQSPIKEAEVASPESKAKPNPSADARSSPANKSFPNKLIRTLSSNNHGNVPPSPEARRDSSNGIDPLSQLILDRTRPENVTLQKMRSAADGEPEGNQNGSPATPVRVLSDQISVKGDTSGSTKEKKKGVSFLSRFMGSKKKDVPDETFDDESEYGEKRVEGTDADLFSHPIEYIPKFPAPPKYIKVRSRGKKEKDFNRVFLAQELRGRTGAEIAQAGGRRLVKTANMTPEERVKHSNAIWKMEFSKDGKFLAAGGHDGIVRVWAVIATPEDRQAHERQEDEATKGESQTRLSAPVFKTKPVQEYQGHTASVLDLSWSKNNFLLSSAMDRTVRLWHSSRTECLCCFQHNDIVTSVCFHPRDDRFFLAGSIDTKLRLWSIPDKSVAHWSQASDLITAVAFTPDGKTAIAGCLSGLCLFYETEGLRHQTQMHVKSAHGKNAKGSKITGIQTINYPPLDPNGEVKLLITSNDSRVRVYNMRDKGLQLKLKGNENSTSQIQATFSDDAKYIICGSEDKKAYIWSTTAPDKDKGKHPLEMFEAHSAAVTAAIMAPARTRQLLQSSGDPLYDLCNPPPVTLVSRTGSHSSRPSTDNGQGQYYSSVPPTPTIPETPKTPTKPEESPAYIARSIHPEGNIIVTADYMGRIKVWRKDCAYKKRLRNDNWDTNSTFSKKMLNRSSSIATRNSKRDSFTHPSSDRIISWRQSIERGNTGPSSVNSSSDNMQAPRTAGFPRSPSPNKSFASTPRNNSTTHPLSNSTTHSPSASSAAPPRSDASFPSSNPRIGAVPPRTDDPIFLDASGSSYAFYHKAAYASQAASAAITRMRTAELDGHGTDGSKRSSIDSGHINSSNGGDSGHLRPEAGPWRRGASVGSRDSRVSLLSSEEEELRREHGGEAEGEGTEDEEAQVRCRKCGGENFRARIRAGDKRLECVRCGMLAV